MLPDCVDIQQDNKALQAWLSVRDTNGIVDNAPILQFRVIHRCLLVFHLLHQPRHVFLLHVNETIVKAQQHLERIKAEMQRFTVQRNMLGDTECQSFSLAG